MICTVVVTKEDDYYIAKDLRTSVTDQGQTMDEALANLKEALELYYDDNESLIPVDNIMYTTSNSANAR